MFILPLAVLLSSTLAKDNAPSPTLAGLVAAEYAFAEQVEKQGMRTGFLAALRKDSTVFVPQAVSGAQFYGTQLETGALLTWYPSVAEVSESGDLGYATGPWTFRASREALDGSQGWFVTLWQREGQGPWKVRLDIGIPTPDPADRPVPAALPRSAAPLAAGAAAPGDPAEILAFDRAFAKAAAHDPKAAYAARVDEKVRFYRKNRFPVEGSKALAMALDADAVAWEPAEGFVSSGGDLACTRGTLTHTDASGATTSNYVRMWKKASGSWKLVLDLELALPAKK